MSVSANARVPTAVEARIAIAISTDFRIPPPKMLVISQAHVSAAMRPSSGDWCIWAEKYAAWPYRRPKCHGHRALISFKVNETLNALVPRMQAGHPMTRPINKNLTIGVSRRSYRRRRFSSLRCNGDDNDIRTGAVRMAQRHDDCCIGSHAVRFSRDFGRATPATYPDRRERRRDPPNTLISAPIMAAEQKKAPPLRTALSLILGGAVMRR